MHCRSALITALAVFILVTSLGCTTSGGSGSGWVVVGQQDSSPTPAPKKAPAPKAKGMETAARNHIRSAYRFLEKGKPDHAMRELEKARGKMGNNYWFHYYMGGAYFMKGMYQQADESWNMAFRYTSDSRMGSRLRTCQSFAINHLRGEEQSIGFLKAALELDGDNGQARELLDDMASPGNEGKKGRGKNDRDKGKSEKKKPRKIKDRDRFSAYFLVEMP